MRKNPVRYAILLGSLATAIVAYTIYWFSLAGRMEDEVAAGAEALSAQGLTISYDSISVSGFPFRLISDLEELNVTVPRADGDLNWRAERLRLVAEPWKDGHVILLLEGEQDITHAAHDGSEKSYAITTDRARASVVTPGNGSARFSFAAETVDILARATGKHVTAAEAQLHLLQLPPVPVEAAAEENGEADSDPSLPQTAQLDLYLAGITVPEEASPVLGPNIERIIGRISVNGSVLGTRPEQLQAWAQAGGTLDLTGFAIDWDEMQMEAAGTVTLDDANRPLGAFETRFANVNSVAALLQIFGTTDAESLRLARAALETMEEGRQGTSATVPFTMQNGFLYMGAIPLTDLEPVSQ